MSHKDVHDVIDPGHALDGAAPRGRSRLVEDHDRGVPFPVELQRLVLANTSDAFFVATLDGEITWAGSNIETIFAYTGHEVMQLRTVRSLLGEPRFSSDELRQAGELADMEWVVHDKNGACRTLLVTARLVGPEPESVLYTCRDVTRLRAAEAALDASTRELQLTLDATTEGIWKWQFDTNEMHFSSRYYSMLGYEPGEFAPSYESWVNLIHPDDLNDAIAVAELFLARLSDTYENEFRLRCKDGSYRWIRAHGQVVEHDENGRALRMIGNHQDITERKEAHLARQEALDAARRASKERQELFTAAKSVLVETDFTTSARRLFDTCRHLTGAVAGYVALLSDDGCENEVLFLESGGIECTVDPLLPMPIRGLRERAYRTRRAVWDNEFATSRWTEFLPAGHVSIQSVLFVPLNIEERTVGLLGLANKPGGFSEHDVEIAEVIGDLAAVVLRNSRTRQEILESEQRYRNLFDTIADAVIVTDPTSGEIIDANQAAEDLIGKRRSHIIGQRLAAIHPDADDRFVRIFERTDEETGDEDTTLDGLVLHDTGRSVPVEVRARTTTFAGGRKAVLGSFRDLTRRREAELKAQSLVSLVQQLSDSVIQTDLDFRITYVNRAAEELFGWSMDELRGQQPSLFNAESITEAERQQLRTTVATGQVFTGEWLMRRKDGTTFLCQHRVEPLRDSVGNIVGYAGSHRDVTAQRQLEQRLRQAEKMDAVGQLAAGIAHDFNNQLGGILGYADLLLEELDGDPDLLEYVNGIIAGATRSAALTDQLLTFSQKTQPEMKPVDIHELLHDVTSMLQRTIDKRICLTVNLAASPATTVGDAALLGNALLNITLNSRDAMPHGGELTMATSVTPRDQVKHLVPSTSISERFVVVTITDTGTGMDDEIRRRVFEPFFTTKGGKGTGMGLATAYGTVTSHGGAIELKSKPGTGTSVRILLPQVPSATPDAQAPDVRPTVTQARLLIVEDEKVMRNMLEGMLRSMGHEVTTCINGQAALDLFRATPHDFDLVILDLDMPALNGLDTFLAMRELNPNQRAVLSSGYFTEQARERFLGAGGSALLRKPYRLANLRKVMSQALEE